MNNKKMIVIPPLSSFENTLEIKDRKIKAAVFIPNKSNNPNLHSLESTLGRLRFLDIVGWYTDEKGYQRGSHRVKKIFDLYSKKGIDIIICYSREDFLEIESCGCPVHCIKESTYDKR